VAAPIDFAGLAAALLARVDSLLPIWLPGGRFDGNEYKCGDLSGGKGDSLSVNTKTGAWADFANDGDRGGDLTSLYAAIRGMNNAQAARALMVELGWEREAVQTPASPGARHARDVAASASQAADGPPEPPIADDERPSKKRNDSDWHPIVPVPANTPEPTFKHWHRGLPSRTWEYRFEGELFGYVCRYDTSDGGKEILPHTWCEDASDGRGTRRWHFKQWDDPRPLYVPATLLSGDSSLPVVIVEGEKCAEAGHKLLGHEFRFVSWPGGGKAWAKARWGWLLGRTVYLWPDADAKRQRLSREEREAGVDAQSKPLQPLERQPGWQTMVGIGSHLMADQGCTVYMCKIPAPGDVSDGWDIADAIEQGWDAATVRGFIRGAYEFVPPDDAVRAKAAALPPLGSAGAGQEDDLSQAWRIKLLTSKSGATVAVRENVVLALDGIPDKGIPGIAEVQGVIAYNEFTNDIVKLKDTPWGTPAGTWDEVDELLMGEWLVREHWLPPMPRGTLEEGMRMVAYRHRYHPVREYLAGLEWDGEPRLATWLRRCCLEEDEFDDRDPLQQFLARAGTWFLMGMCTRVMEPVKLGGETRQGPGTKFDYMLILEGAQGLGKSTLFRVLAGEWFADTGLVLGDKDSYQQLQGRWLYEMGELDAMGKADITKVKGYLASTNDYYRGSFDKRASDHPRQVVFGGTTNEDHYLADSSGNRRFWPVRVTRQVDLKWLRENRDQLFAEAVQRVLAGKRMHPTPDEERELFVPQQKQRAVEGAIESAVNRFLNEPPTSHGREDGTLLQEVTLVELLGKVGIGLEKLGPGRFHEKQAAAALRGMGWVEARSSRPGRPRVYKRPSEQPAPAMLAGRASDSQSFNGPTQGNSKEGADGCPF
jgi:putative DNA primase/helicase